MRGPVTRRWVALAMFAPSTWTCPDWIRLAPAISASRLDLPTPSGPIRPTMRRAGMSSVSASRAVRLP